MKRLPFYVSDFRKLLLNLSIISFLFLNISLNYLPFERDMMMEICDNAIDDDGDGMIDLNDTDCDCEVVEPVSLIPNPSFEDLNCCPSDRSQLNCAEVWIQASEPTTDLIHACGWFGWDEFPPPVPFPDGEGIMGFRDGRVRGNNSPETNWKEYAGACLLNPLEADSVYRFEFDLGFVNTAHSPPINITIFGTTDCNNLPFGIGNEALGCPTNGLDWVRLGSNLVSGGVGNKWVKTAIEISPTENITAIAIGPDCPAVNNSVHTYYFFDNLLLADINAFDLQVSTVNHPCQDNFSLKVNNNTAFEYQWFKDGIALIGETNTQIEKNYGEGNYQVRIEDGVTCKVSLAYEHNIPEFSTPSTQIICKDETYQFGSQILSESGVYTEIFKNRNNCDSMVTLNLKILGAIADTVNVQIFEGETYQIERFKFRREGVHLVDLVSSKGCDSLVLLQLEYYTVFIPNVFSPNQDGVNDKFAVLSEHSLIETSELTIFDRWGTQVFNGVEWDGKFDGKSVSNGVFLYVADVLMSDGITRQFFGEVTVLR